MSWGSSSWVTIEPADLTDCASWSWSCILASPYTGSLACTTLYPSTRDSGPTIGFTQNAKEWKDNLRGVILVTIYQTSECAFSRALICYPSSGYPALVYTNPVTIYFFRALIGYSARDIHWFAKHNGRALFPLEFWTDKFNFCRWLFTGFLYTKTIIQRATNVICRSRILHGGENILDAFHLAKKIKIKWKVRIFEISGQPQDVFPGSSYGISVFWAKWKAPMDFVFERQAELVRYCSVHERRR